MTIITKDKNYYKKLLFLALPIAFQNLIDFSVNLADTFMIGQLGETELAASNLSGRVMFILMLFVFGLTSGANVLIAQFWGSKDVKSIHSVFTITLRCAIAGSFIFSYFAIFMPVQLMSLFTKAPGVVDAGADFLAIIGYSYILSGISSSLTKMLRPTGSVAIGIVGTFVSLTINIFLNWVLIFGKLGFPAMGIKGDALSTLIARIAEFIIIIFYFLFIEKKIQYKLKYFFARKIELAKKFFVVTIPVVLNEVGWALGATVISVIIGHLGVAFTVADSVNAIISQLVTIVIWGVSHASAVIVGNAIGEGKPKLAKEYAYTSVFVGLLLGLVSCGVVLLIRDPIIGLFDLTPETIMYAKQIINAYAIIVIFQGVSGVGLIGVIRGGGDSKFVLVMDIIFMWIFCIPIGYIASFKLALPVGAIYFILKSDEIFKAIGAIYKMYRDDWIHDLTR